MNATTCPGAGGASAGTVCIETGRSIPLAASLDLWRREARFGQVDTGRYRCRYFTWGAGPPIVFIHGLADQAQSFVPVMANLRMQFTCIGYELPAGRDDGARLGAYRHEQHVADLKALLDHLQMRQAYLFGSSFGSTIAMAALQAHAARFPRAVLQGGFARRPLSIWERRISQFLRYRRCRLGDLWLRRNLQQFVDRAEHAVFRQQRCEAEWEFLRANSGESSCAAAARRALSLDHFDLSGKLPDIHQPILLIVGERDSIVPESCELALQNGLPNVARVDVPDCGHYPQYTHAGLVSELIRQFLMRPNDSQPPCPLL